MSRHRWFDSWTYNIEHEGNFVKIVNKYTGNVEETYTAGMIDKIYHAPPGSGRGHKHYIYFKGEIEKPEININITRDDFDDEYDDDKLDAIELYENMMYDEYENSREDYIKNHAKKDYLKEKARTDNFAEERRKIPGIENLSHKEQDELLFEIFVEEGADKYTKDRVKIWEEQIEEEKKFRRHMKIDKLRTERLLNDIRKGKY